uniref:ISXO2-like transposase domain-containing protein n=1 Tax=Ditylenchus dipsaci TaxID=166011 RepID=A0A915CLA0_9BILA
MTLHSCCHHFDVSHKENFVDPEDKEVHTQGVESMHQKLKHRHKKEYGTSRTHLVSYIEEFLWRKLSSGKDMIYHFWKQVSEYYVCEK